MLQIRKSATRGLAEHGWLSSRHTFSFASYYDPRYVSFGPLRVINEDKVIGGQGFGTHSHSNMEIVSYVLGGALEHKDSMGTGSVLRYGDVQRMSAGSGVSHSEFNHSASDPVHFLQIWIFPEAENIAPSYEETHFTPESKRGQLRLIASISIRMRASSPPSSMASRSCTTPWLPAAARMCRWRVASCRSTASPWKRVTHCRSATRHS